MSQQLTPWTTTASIRWRPTPKAYDCRTSLLTTLEDQKRLRAFHIQDTTAHAILDGDIELMVGIDQFSVAFADSFPERASLLSILDLVIESVKPRVSLYSARFQHLSEIAGESDYASARQAAIERIFGSLALDLRITDTAILIDGSSLVESAVYQAEFGIVRKAEATARLTQGMSRLGFENEPDFSHIDWSKKDIPDVALYVDSRWHQHQAAPLSITGEWLYSRLEEYRAEADQLTERLLRQNSSSQRAATSRGE